MDCIVQELETAETAAVTQLLTEILLDEPAEAAGAVLGQGSKETGGRMLWALGRQNALGSIF